MSDETQTETTQTSETKEGAVVFQSQADFDAVIQRRLAKEKEKFADYDNLKGTVEKLQQEKEEREQAEMSELDKARAALEDAKGQVEQLGEYKTKVEQFETSLREQNLKAMEGWPEEDQELVLKLPLVDQPAAIKRLSNESAAAESAGSRGRVTGSKTVKEIYEMPPGPARDAAYAEYRKTVK